MLKPSPRILLAMLFLFTLSSTVEATLYRWKDENGKLHMESTIPPEASIRGYDVLNDKGRVIQRVRPAEELKQQQAKQDAARKRREAAEQQRKEREKRQALLDKYPNIDAIKLTRNGKITYINDLRNAKKDYILKKQAQLEKLQMKAEESERNKKPIALSLLHDIDRLRKKISRSVIDMIKMENEKQATWTSYTDELYQYAKTKGVKVEPEDENAIKTKLSVSTDAIYECKDKDDCAAAWKLAKTFLRQHATRRIQIQGKDFIITAAAVAPTDISIAIMRVASDHEASAGDGKSRVYMGLLCANSPAGRELCKSEKVKQIRHSFLPTISRETAEPAPPAVEQP
ncbi:MAG: DUF4124 domain-containing protein [gamma proteobacterium symbiont of Bathyaustriella thionipta]|nr:DUF4124 domain-containing protein [gamma proteobacterium symbiont of Bathyaustriella thionipta]